ncbi:Hint domain-containing protein [Acetobacter thailandicus]|uniref:Hint domain-containing protein n=1 Tax=Acetobacter thailandicus TaxID=1502842 RepID=UPI001BA6FBC5|nr:Hint domain-containing protein [Acetobacter thailandicus]
MSVSGGELNLLDDSVSKDVTLDDGVVSGTSQARIFGLTVNSGSAAFTGSWLNDVQVSGGTLNIYESVTVDQLDDITDNSAPSNGPLLVTGSGVLDIGLGNTIRKGISASENADIAINGSGNGNTISGGIIFNGTGENTLDVGFDNTISGAIITSDVNLVMSGYDSATGLNGGNTIVNGIVFSGNGSNYIDIGNFNTILSGVRVYSGNVNIDGGAKVAGGNTIQSGLFVYGDGSNTVSVYKYNTISGGVVVSNADFDMDGSNGGNTISGGLVISGNGSQHVNVISNNTISSGMTVSGATSVYIGNNNTITNPGVDNGGLIITDPEQTTIGNQNSFSNGVTISGGTLSFGSQNTVYNNDLRLVDIVSGAVADNNTFYYSTDLDDSDVTYGNNNSIYGVSANNSVIGIGNGNTIYSSGFTGSGGTFTIGSGNTISGVNVVNELVSAGAGNNFVSNTFIGSGAVLSTTGSAGGSNLLSSGTVASGGSLFLGAYGRMTSGALIVSGGGIATLSGPSTVVNTLSNYGGTTYVSSGGTVGTTTISGGTVGLSSGATMVGTANIGQDGTLELAGNNGTGTITFSGSEEHPSYVVLSDDVVDGKSTVSQTFSGWGTGYDHIIFKGPFTSTKATLTSNNTISLQVGDTTFTLNIPGIGSTGYTLLELDNGYIDLEICFLAGTLIQMASGYVKVEEIKAGDKIMVRQADGNFAEETVKWVGRKHHNVRIAQKYPDLAGYPVCIKKDALAEGVPFKDLLVTPEHSLFIDGNFIPVRMLVNGVNIYYDLEINQYYYYHIETEQHAVIDANGALTESYLNTGNKNSFSNPGGSDAGVVQGYFERPKSWLEDAAAPLATHRELVEPVFRKILNNCHARQVQAEAETTLNPDLYLYDPVTRAMTYPFKKDGVHVFFTIRNEVSRVYLSSLASRPADTIGPFVDDRRELGVRVGDIEVLNDNEILIVNEHLEDKELSGWSVYEGGEGRWTTGLAAIDLPSGVSGKMKIVKIDILSSHKYYIERKEMRNIMRG